MEDYTVVLYDRDYWMKLGDKLILGQHPMIYEKIQNICAEEVGYVKPEHRDFWKNVQNSPSGA